MSNLTLLIGRHSPLRGKVVLTEAVAINCDGWIAANGYDVATRAVHAYLLTPREAHRRECSLPRRSTVSDQTGSQQPLVHPTDRPAPQIRYAEDEICGVPSGDSSQTSTR